MTDFSGLWGEMQGITTDVVILVLADGIGKLRRSFSQLSKSAFSKSAADFSETTSCALVASLRIFI
jgi:hypothetical protein